MKTWIILVCMAALLVGCGGTAVVPTAAPSATAVAALTAVPLDKIAIEPVLLQSGDLPSGVTGGQVKELTPVLFKDVAAPPRALTQALDQNGVPYGMVTVLLYESTSTRDAAYTQMLGAIAITSATGGAAQAGIGEQSFGGLFTNNLPGFAEIVFTRCRAAVHVRINTTDATDVTTYAKRLDKRLEPLVC